MKNSFDYHKYHKNHSFYQSDRSDSQNSKENGVYRSKYLKHKSFFIGSSNTPFSASKSNHTMRFIKVKTFKEEDPNKNTNSTSTKMIEKNNVLKNMNKYNFIQSPSNNSQQNNSNLKNNFHSSQNIHEKKIINIKKTTNNNIKNRVKFLTKERKKITKSIIKRKPLGRIRYNAGAKFLENFLLNKIRNYWYLFKNNLLKREYQLLKRKIPERGISKNNYEINRGLAEKNKKLGEKLKKMEQENKILKLNNKIYNELKTKYKKMVVENTKVHDKTKNIIDMLMKLEKLKIRQKL